MPAYRWGISVAFRIVVYMIACLALCDRACAHGTFQLSPDDSSVTYPDGNQAAVKTTDCKEKAAEVLAQFQQYLADSNEPARLIACELETSTWYLHVIETDYYAGLFILQKGSELSKIAICYNGAIGSTVLKPVTSMTRHELIIFMMGNCTSG
jgi:hypothetical protein